MKRLLLAAGLSCAFGTSAHGGITVYNFFCEEQPGGVFQYTIELLLKDCLFLPEPDFQPFLTLVDIPGLFPPDPIVDFDRPAPYPWLSELFVDFENENAGAAGVFDDPGLENLSVIFIPELPDVPPLNGPFVLGTLSFTTIGVPVLFELSVISGAFDGFGTPVITGGTVQVVPGPGPAAMLPVAMLALMRRRLR